jgi:hypothetical protein
LFCDPETLSKTLNPGAPVLEDVDVADRLQRAQIDQVVRRKMA